MRGSTICVVLILLYALLCMLPLHATSRCDKSDCLENAKKDETDIFREFWEWRLVNAPEFATSIGVYKYDDRLDEMSLSSYSRRLAESKAFLKRVKTTPSKSNSSNRSDLEL